MALFLCPPRSIVARTVCSSDVFQTPVSVISLRFLPKWKPETVSAKLKAARRKPEAEHLPNYKVYKTTGLHHYLHHRMEDKLLYGPAVGKSQRKQAKMVNSKETMNLSIVKQSTAPHENEQNTSVPVFDQENFDFDSEQLYGAVQKYPKPSKPRNHIQEIVLEQRSSPDSSEIKSELLTRDKDVCEKTAKDEVSSWSEDKSNVNFSRHSGKYCDDHAAHSNTSLI